MLENINNKSVNTWKASPCHDSCHSMDSIQIEGNSGTNIIVHFGNREVTEPDLPKLYPMKWRQFHYKVALGCTPYIVSASIILVARIAIHYTLDPGMCI